MTTSTPNADSENTDGTAVELQPEHFGNRDLSWLEFNLRVLEEAEDETNFPLERIKFLSIFASNLDEFFMVRVSGLRSQILGVDEAEDELPERLTAQEIFQQAHARTRELVDRQYRCLNEQVLPQLATHGIRLLGPEALSDEQRVFVDDFFRKTVYPVLTPMAIDPSHPTPHLRNRGLYLAATIEQSVARNGSAKTLLAVVQLPSNIARLIRLPGEKHEYLLLEQLIASQLSTLFGGSRILRVTTMRITRDADFDIDGDQVLQDLSQAVEEGLKALRHREAVRLEVGYGTDPDLLEAIRRPLKLQPGEIYEIAGPLDLTTFMDWHGLEAFPQLRDEPFTSRKPFGVDEAVDVFKQIRERDVFVHHPFESFSSVVEFLRQAAEDPDVLAIKQTLYRAGSESPVIRALINASEKGKQVTAVVELLARFDEQSNVNWARQLERAGVHVVYGFVELKTHCKITLVVRREGNDLRRYVHLGTGNYNATTGRLYTDFGLFTAAPEFGEDATALFNLLTGYSQGHAWHRFVVSPYDMHSRVLALIGGEEAKARRGEPARILAKFNALVDPDVVKALYRASQAGVKIDLIVRGSCCLKPGIPGVSDNIRVTSILDRFLEHSRVYVFGAGADADVYVASADWMPRNFHRRVEVMFPLLDPAVRQRVLGRILPILLEDNVKARVMHADGKYTRVTRAENAPKLRAQVRLIAEAHEGGPRGESGGQVSTG
jgi:polyphosphate kinase